MAVSYNKVAGAIDYLMEGLNSGTDQWAFALASSVPGSPTFVAGTTDLAREQDDEEALLLLL